MPEHHHSVPLNELAVAVQSAVQQVLAQHGAVSIDKLWVGFVAPENIANQVNADKVAKALGKEAGVSVQGAMAQQVAATHEAGAVPGRPGHSIGLVFSPR